MNDPFDHRGDMTEAAHETWCGVIAQLIRMQIALVTEGKIEVGRGQYRMHTQRSPNVRRAAHE